MITITNNWIIIDKDDNAFMPLSINLSIQSKEFRFEGRGKKKTGEMKSITHYLYEIRDSQMYVPIGLLDLISREISGSDISDRRTYSKICNTEEAIKNIDKYSNILPGITLRNDQLLAIRKILYSKRCLTQMATSFGKTEVLCGVTKVLTDINDGICPTILLMEPTIRLVKDTVERFRKYDIEAVAYSDNREIVKNCVNICHPMSVGNDLKNDNNLLKDVEVLMGDECHHFRSESFRNPTKHMDNIMYSIGVSASAISKEHVGCKSVREYTYPEALVISATGPLVLNITAKTLITNKTLADPILFVLHNKADEEISQVNDWHEISKVRLESDYRSRLVCKAAEIFCNANRKSLILVNTRRWARDIMKILDEYGISEYCRASFGGNTFEKYNGEDFIIDKDDVMNKFKSGEYRILIGTSHLYEGADIPNLDAIILAYGGAGERLQIQGLGRVLRKTKTGKYAYIVDFTDTEDIILSKHSRNRMKRYREIIGIEDDHIYYDVSCSDIKRKLYELENL